ncbi:hypothetical protein B4U79_17453 [Dinothrombium tinctorium]|uniref:Uncharacterized protein n=1 Tax=Dinothrombium tinctorium TaxID=1965070 RepID=A0A443RB65_9ACAR|nr:hypothetical protein B4U79_17453 [Dinothrombium tinctorium]
MKSKSEEMLKNRRDKLTVIIDGNDEKLDFLTQFFSNTNVVKVCKRRGHSLRPVLSKLVQKQIEHLELSGILKDDHLRRLSSTFSNVKHLKLSFDDGLLFTEVGISLMLLKFKNLESVEFSTLGEPLWFVAPNTTDAMASHQFLSVLHLKNVFFALDEFQKLIEAKATNLKCLELEYYGDDPIDANSLLKEIFDNCKNLIKLKLVFYYISIGNAEMLDIPCLTSLYLAFNNFVLTPYSEQFKSVIDLKLCIKETSDENFARILSSFPNVENLTMKWCLYESSLTSLAISRLNKLKKLIIASSLLVDPIFNENDVEQIFEFPSVRSGYSQNVTRILTAARKCVRFELHKISSEEELTAIVDAFEQIANERSDEIIKVKFFDYQPVFRPLPHNLKLTFKSVHPTQ